MKAFQPTIEHDKAGPSLETPCPVDGCAPTAPSQSEILRALVSHASGGQRPDALFRRILALISTEDLSFVASPGGGSKRQSYNLKFPELSFSIENKAIRRAAQEIHDLAQGFEALNIGARAPCDAPQWLCAGGRHSVLIRAADPIDAQRALRLSGSFISDIYAPAPTENLLCAIEAAIMWREDPSTLDDCFIHAAREIWALSARIEAMTASLAAGLAAPAIKHVGAAVRLGSPWREPDVEIVADLSAHEKARLVLAERQFTKDVFVQLGRMKHLDLISGQVLCVTRGPNGKRVTLITQEKYDAFSDSGPNGLSGAPAIAMNEDTFHIYRVVTQIAQSSMNRWRIHIPAVARFHGRSFGGPTLAAALHCTVEEAPHASLMLLHRLRDEVLVASRNQSAILYVNTAR